MNIVLKVNEMAMRVAAVFFGVLLMGPVLYGSERLQVLDLRCDYTENPSVIDHVSPLLQWRLTSAKRAHNQSAYRILVASSLSKLSENKGDYWDSGRVYSSSSVVTYRGKAPGSRDQLYWKVMVWDDDSTGSHWSRVASWTMGLLHPSDWQAKWIGQREDPFPDSAITFPAPYFRKEFTISKKVRNAVAYVSGLGFYELSINGEKVGDQVLSPAVTNYDKRSLHKLLYHYDDQSSQRVFYHAFDVTDRLGNRGNAIGMVLGNGWYNQRDRTIEGHMWYDLPKLIFQLEIEYVDGTKQVVVSDESWKTAAGPLRSDGIFTGEVYDARLEHGDWTKASYPDRHWSSAISVRAPTGALRVQSVPFTRVQDTIKGHFERLTDTSYRYTLPETVSGWCAIRVQGRAGDTVKLRFIAEEGFDYGQEDVYVLKGGDQELWEPRFTWHTFRKIDVTAKNVRLATEGLAVKSIFTDVGRVGDFECSNALFNKIDSAFARTMHANFKGIVSSDPHRERLAYTGDAQVIVGSLLNTFDMTRFLKKMFDDIHDARNKNTGYVPHTAPFGGGGGGPAWGSAYVIMPWAYFLHYGDTSVLEQHYTGMKQWVDYLGTRTDENGLVVREEPNGWCLGEWCTPYNQIAIPPHFVNTAYYYHVAQTVARVAGVLGEENDASHFSALAATIKADFNAAFYDAKNSRYWQGRQGSDAFALAFGLVPPGKENDVFTSLIEHVERVGHHFDTGILATPLTLAVLTKFGRADLAYRLMDQRGFPGYGYLLDSQNSTLWETWDGGVDDANGSGRCHPMFGSVVSWFYSSLAGIKPDETSPGMQHFYIAPIPVADLTYCKASYESLHGTIRSHWEIDPSGSFRLDITVPANTKATVILPWEGASIAESGTAIDGAVGVTEIADDRRRIEVGSGTYSFVVER